MRADGALTRLVLLIVLAIFGFLAAAVWLLDLLPPTSLSFAAGRPGGAYHTMALRYRDILARDGITVEIVETAGSLENAALLAAETAPVDVAFLQGGISLPQDAPVEALAATFLEPLWVFHRGALADPADPTQWRGLRIAAGEQGGGTRFVVDSIMQTFDLDLGTNQLVGLGGAAAAEALLEGEVDVALFVAPVDAPYVQPLFTGAQVEPSALRDGEALARQLPFVRLADIPRSGFDYVGEVPSRRIDLITMVGRLVAQSDLHPALVDRLVAAARQVHSGGNVLTPDGTFPSAASVAMPMNPQAADLLASPPNPLLRVLPYWIVAQVDRVVLLFLPFLILLFPLVRAVPGIYQWQMRARVYRRYFDLLEIDRQAMTETSEASLGALETQLEEIEAEVARLRLPVRYREYAYTMRLHIDLVRRRIHDRRAAVASQPSGRVARTGP